MNSLSQTSPAALVPFEEIYHAYKRPIYGYSYRMLGDIDSAKDVTQQVFLTLHERGSEIRRPERVGAWLFAIARHACIALIGQRARHTSLEESPAINSVPGDGDNRELSRLISRAVSRLEPDYREVIILREYCGLPYAEIAAITGTQVSTIKFRLFAARRKLADLLQPTIGKSARLRDR